MDERSPEQTTENRTGFDELLRKLYRPGPLIFLFSLAFFSLAGFAYVLLNQEPPPPQTIVQPPAVAERTEPEEAREYEEATSDLEDHVKQADLAIIETMGELKLKMVDLSLVDVELRQQNGRGYHYQVLQLPKVESRNQFLVTLRKHLYERLPEAALLDNGDSEALIRISNLDTHRLLLEAHPVIIARPEAKGPKVVVVIDDVGENISVLKGLIGLKIPLTFAVWPNAGNTRPSVELITAKKRDLIIHFPMEPLGYPSANPGDDALFVSMTPEQVKAQVDTNLKRIPEAIGVNNHMGSRFTSDQAGMTVALNEFKKNGLFFLDSMTSGKSVGRSTAKTTGIPFYERDIFLDNVKDVNAIVHQLRKTERVALTKGWAIAIGHPYGETLSALRLWQDNLNPSVQVIPLSRLSPE